METPGQQVRQLAVFDDGFKDAAFGSVCLVILTHLDLPNQHLARLLEWYPKYLITRSTSAKSDCRHKCSTILLGLEGRLTA